ncbi:MAG: COX15/CtaA family protein [Bacteroidia bacterium]
MQKLFRFLSYTTLVSTFLVILAGSIVRTTQSGMGCPDWPKCFGYYIPPTEDSQVRFEAGRTYTKGMMVIEFDTLWSAKSKITASGEFNRSEWEKYPKHDYSDFVVEQTWIEYINRLLGALLGIFVFGMFVSSFSYRKTKPILILLSFALVFVTGFQAWLGKLVVDGNLIPQSISIHMLGALILLVLAQIVINKLNQAERYKTNKQVQTFAYIAVLASLIQILIGTQVREEIDVIAKTLGYDMRAAWVDELSSTFMIHRAFSLILAVASGYVIYLGMNAKNRGFYRLSILAMVVLGIELIAGIILGFAGMPAFFQPIHLLLATMLFWVMFALASRKLIG